ncbi:TolC family protein [Thermovibrio sp.]
MNGLTKEVILLTLLFFLPSSSWPITLKEALKLTLKNYPSLKTLALKEKALKEEKERIERERFGELSLITAYQTFNRNYILLPLSNLPKPNNPLPFNSRKATYGVKITVPLWLGGTLKKRAELVNLKAAVLRSLREANAWELKFNVKSIYLTYLSLKEREKALRELLKSLTKLKEDVSFGVKVGKFAKVDLLKVDYSLEKAKADLKRTTEREKALKTALETFVGRKIKTVEPIEVKYSPFNEKLKELEEELLQRNSLLKSLKREVKSARKEEELIKRKYFPKLVINGVLTRNYGFDTGDNEAFGELSVNLSFPIFTGGRKSLEVREKKLLTLSLLKKYQERKRELIRELSRVYSELKATEGEIEENRKALEYAKEVERIEELKYKSGKGDMDHLLLAKSNRYLTEAELNSSYYLWLLKKEELFTLLEVEDEQ